MKKPIIGVTVGTPIKPSAVVEKAKDTLEQVLKDAIQAAKDSGDFKGDPGNDYILTEDDKQDIANLIPSGGGGGGSDHTPDGTTLQVADDGTTSVHGIYPWESSTPIELFVGSQEAYDNLKPEEKENLFALIQDEDDAVAFDDLKKASYTEGLAYALSSDGTSYHCEGLGEANSRYITIPPYHNGKRVAEIAEDAFREEEIRSVVIPDTVTKIGAYAFWGCPQLTSVNFGKGITRIGSGAFYECIALDNVNIPNGCTNIDSYAFCGCTSLKRIFIPRTVSVVGANAFLYCSNVTIYVESGVLSTLWSDQWNPDNCIVLRNITAPNAQSVIHAIAADRADLADRAGRATTADSANLLTPNNVWRCVPTGERDETIIPILPVLEDGLYAVMANMTQGTEESHRVVTAIVYFTNALQRSDFVLTTDYLSLICTLTGSQISITERDGSRKYRISYLEIRRLM